MKGGSAAERDDFAGGLNFEQFTKAVHLLVGSWLGVRQVFKLDKPNSLSDILDALKDPYIPSQR